MTLVKQQWIFFGAALAVLTVLAGMLVGDQRRVAQALDHLSEGQSLMRTILMMRIIAGEVSIDRTDRHEVHWQAGMRSAIILIDSVQRGTASENVLLQKIRRSMSDADELFHRFVASTGSRVADVEDGQQAFPINDRINDALQLALGNVNMAALQLSELEAQNVRVAREKVLFTSTFLFVVMLLILAGYLIVFRRSVLAPVNRLQTAADRIASGDLAHRVGLRARTELGDLGRRFDHMAEQIEAARGRMTASNKELEAFAYSVSHDLRAPLRGMDGFSRILLEQYGPQMNEDARHCLQMIRDNAVQMGRLIDDLLAFSRLSQQPLRKEYVDQDALVHGVVKDFLAEAKDRKIRFDVGELAGVDADPRLLRQVWRNLIGNAVKYTRHREAAVIGINSELQDAVRGYSISDNGVGFDMRYAQKLFGVFQRLHRAEEYEGTGVGLAIVQRIVHRHGGRIWAEAQTNQGATFHFTLQGADDDDRERSRDPAGGR